MSDTYTPRVNESILQNLRGLTDQTIAQQTADALDYTPDELDDLTSRKVEEAPFSGDALARIIRARRGTARATGHGDPYQFVNTNADYIIWGRWTAPAGLGPHRTDGNRRMAAVGTSGDFGTLTSYSPGLTEVL